MAITRKMSLQLRERDPYCDHCGADTELQVHHRQNRGMGGRPKNSLDKFDNLIRVCSWLNYAMEQDPAVAREAREKGWKLGQWEKFETPVYDRMQDAWFILTPKGGKVQVEEPTTLF